MVRTVASLLSGIPESNIRVVSPEIGGGFGNKVGVYPGYVCSIVASIVTGRPVKWIENRMDNLMATAFARDYWMQGKIAATKEGKITGLWCHLAADHGAFDACADPTRVPRRFLTYARVPTTSRTLIWGWTGIIPPRRRAGWRIAVPSG